MFIRHIFILKCVIIYILFPQYGFASSMNSQNLPPVFGIPFLGLLFSLAILPVLYPNFWKHHLGKIVLIWSLIFLIPFYLKYGVHISISCIVTVFFSEYAPFVILLTVLFVVSSGICIRGFLPNTPIFNTSILAFGAMLASLVGTTSASILLIRPIICANKTRKYNKHIFVFFIFLVANVGGSLTPLGDPPLFLGFLKGVSFFWVLENIFFETCFLCSALLVIFYCLDCYYYKLEQRQLSNLLNKINVINISFLGINNIVLLALTISWIFIGQLFTLNFQFTFLSMFVTLDKLLFNGVLILIVLISLWITPKNIYLENRFSWNPILEVIKLFAGIFVTMIPIITILQSEKSSVFSSIIGKLTDQNGYPINAMYFWLTGLLSSFLDNAPTYLLFFNIASGDANLMMTTFSRTLTAISAGAVFMGANSYIGNAPNMMIKAIVEYEGIQMPSFLAYIGWSSSVLIPLFVGMTYIFFV